ncbi:MAG: single-stranded-DNA-specific exonuclease RecJ [Eubacteriales bacterium]
MDYDKMSQQLKLSEAVCRIMVNRGITSREDIDSYIHAGREKLHDPRLMRDMQKVINILRQKIKEEKRIRIVSDYDVDGIISCYILYTALKRCNGKVDYYIPHRVTEGYGINEHIVREAKREGIDTIITCDNGIAAISQVQLAKQLEMTVIITDHHEVPYRMNESGEKIYEIPIADAILNPKQKQCTYPFKALCGAGVVFKLVQGLYHQCAIPFQEVFDYLQFVAIATVCDIVDLIGENRIIVKHGLDQMNHTTNIGLKALLKVNNLHNKKINGYTLGFIIGPCLNAAGRLGHAHRALELLLEEEPITACKVAEEILNLNQERKDLTEKGLQDVLNILEDENAIEDKVKVIFNHELHESVIGIIAGRVKDLYHLPVIILTSSEDCVKGSGRSIENYHLYDELSYCKDILVKFGGHAMAAGLSIKQTDISLLRERLNSRFSIDDEDLKPRLYIDVLLPIEKVTKKLIDELEILEPFGKGNTKPIFGDKAIRIFHARTVGKNNNILKLQLMGSNGEIKEGIIFNQNESIKNDLVKKWGEEEVNKLFIGQSNRITVDVAYYPKVNTYMGNETLQIHILQLK